MTETKAAIEKAIIKYIEIDEDGDHTVEGLTKSLLEGTACPLIKWSIAQIMEG